MTTDNDPTGLYTVVPVENVLQGVGEVKWKSIVVLGYDEQNELQGFSSPSVDDAIEILKEGLTRIENLKEIASNGN
jgi:hypothetical protein